MTTTSWLTSSTRFARGAVVATFVVTAGIALHGERAAVACGGGDFAGITELTTFDPKVLGEPIDDGLFYDPFTSSFSGTCDGCAKSPMLDDWKGYLKDAVKPADWEKVLFAANENELAAIANRLAGRSKTGPKSFEQSSLWNPAAKDRLIPAVAFVQLARRIEQYASFELYDPDGNQRQVKAPPEDALTAARAGMKAARDPFLVQRYAYQVLRATFYRRDWPAVVAFFDKNQALLATPSADLAWNARHYVAGALIRGGNRARGNVELARIHAGYPLLAGRAVQAFQPMEDKDFRESLKLATTVRDKAELWRLVGIKKDGIVAMQEILKLDPKSNLVPLLLVRELAKAESRAGERAWEKPDAKDLAAQKKLYAAVEQIALGQLGRGGDRPWLMELVAGHIAAKRGELATARSRLQRAVAGKPNDARVASQAKASLAMALVASWKIAPQTETELAQAMTSLAADYGRKDAVRSEVRRKLATIYAQAGQVVDAEFLEPGTVDAADPKTGKPPAKRKWSEAGFIRDMIARTGKVQTEFDKFVLAGSFTKPTLENELAMRLMLDGDFAGAAKMKLKTDKLGTDPFVIHIKDCHDCDHEKYAAAKWTSATFVARLVELDAKVKAGGEPGAEAALALGNALYNITWWGNARVVLEDTHQATSDASAAMRWYKRAYELSKNRELKAKAAFLAAKAELGTLLENVDPYGESFKGLPVPKTWFPIVKQYANTKYYKEVLAECGHFARWAKQ